MNGKTAWVVLLVVLAVLLVAPLGLGSYWQQFLTILFVNIVLAQAWNVMGGYAGSASFGHGVFFGLGAYIAAEIIIRYGLGFPLALLAGGIGAVLLSLVFYPILRLRGYYFSLATLASLFAVQTIFKSWRYTRGLGHGGLGSDVGWAFPMIGDTTFFYYVMLMILLVTLVTTFWIIRSKVGYGLQAIKEDEIVAASIGIPNAWYKTIAFAFSAFWPGVVGAAYGPFITYISTESMFNLSSWTLAPIVAVMLGGIGNFWGAVVGTLIITVVNQFVWANFLLWHEFIYGIFIIAIVIFIPQGIVPLLQSLVLRFHEAAPETPLSGKAEEG